jgi:hypothetical protein
MAPPAVAKTEIASSSVSCADDAVACSASAETEHTAAHDEIFNMRPQLPRKSFSRVWLAG